MVRRREPGKDPGEVGIVSDREQSRCKGPEADASVVCWKKSEKVGAAERSRRAGEQLRPQAQDGKEGTVSFPRAGGTERSPQGLSLHPHG